MAAQLGRMANIDMTYIWPGMERSAGPSEEALRAQVGPFVGGSIVAQYMVFEAARAAGFKVLLGGQGGDEAFMGYRKFQVFHFRRLMARRRYLAAFGFAHVASADDLCGAIGDGGRRGSPAAAI